ncbi:MAG: ArsR/SmtB family transcription factor [Asticcacaulis sp.]
MNTNTQRPDSHLDATFAALSDTTRRRILERLALGDASVGDLTALFQLTQPTISRHLQVLENAGLITTIKDAQRRLRRLVRNPLDGATAWLMGYRNPGTLRFLIQADRTIVMKRAFWVPQAQVFDAFVNPTLLKQWFYGKPGGTLAVCEPAAKEGETFRYVWRDADGNEMGMSGLCMEFKRPERLVATEQFDPPWSMGSAVGTIELQQHGDITVLTHTSQYGSREVRDMMVATQMEHAVALGYDRLETLLTSLERKRRKE